ncbi:MAG: glutaredoxin domain-containing protein [Synechococcus sp. ELA057]
MHAKGFLDRKGITYNEFVIDNDPELLEVMLQRAGAKSKAPQIFINGRGVGGWQQLEALEAAGELDVMLDQKPRDIVQEEIRAANRPEGAAGQDRPAKGGVFSRFLRP